MDERERKGIHEWSRSLMNHVISQPKTIGVDLGSWERSVEWAYDPKTHETRVVKDHGWKRIGSG